MNIKLSEIVAKFGGELVGEDLTISSIAPTNLAQSGQITFLSDNKFKKNLINCQADAIIIKAEDADGINIPKIITHNPYFYFSQVSSFLNPRRKLKIGIAPSAYIDESSCIGQNVAIAHHVAIGENVKIGDNCQIFPNVVIGDNVIIGDNTTIYPTAVIYDNIQIGNGCVIHSGAAIGSDGFGNAKDDKMTYHRIPQIGGVIIGNNVEIGSNTTIDCGTFEATIIADGVSIDNLVQIAHNVKIGAHTGIASQVGIAGNSKIGRYCMLAGNVGIADHVEICDHTVISASSNVAKNITKPALYACGMTVMEYKDWAKTFVHLRNIDKLNQKVKELYNKLEQLGGNKNDN